MRLFQYGLFASLAVAVVAEGYVINDSYFILAIRYLRVDIDIAQSLCILAYRSSIYREKLLFDTDCLDHRNGPIESGCGNVATVFVTAAPVTKTVSIVSYVTAIERKASSSSSDDITRTSTDFITLVHVLNSAKAIPTTAIAEKGPYYYTENKGTRVWLGGKSPPTGKPLVTSTTIITYHPVPLSEYVANTGNAEPATDLTYVSIDAVTKGSVEATANQAHISANPETGGKAEPISYYTIAVTEILTILSTEGDAEPTGFSSVVSTVIRTRYETETLTRTHAVSSADVASSTATNTPKILTGSRSAGWNTTAKAVIKAKGAQTGTQLARLSPQQSGVKENAATRAGTVSSLTALYRSSDAIDNNIEARQLGVVITATIGGLVVSWTNNYGGPSITPTPLPTNDNLASQTDSVRTGKFHDLVSMTGWTKLMIDKKHPRNMHTLFTHGTCNQYPFNHPQQVPQNQSPYHWRRLLLHPASHN